MSLVSGSNLWLCQFPESNNNKDLPNNYRPISLLSVLSKLLERHVHKLLADHLSTHHPLSNSQWGFSEGKSTVTALLTTTHEWFQSLEEGKEICAVFFDFKKAFDSVPHRPLVTKLQQMGVPDHVLLWIASYLTCRSQRVVVNGATSQSMPVLSGVPQGTSNGTSDHFLMERATPLISKIKLLHFRTGNSCPSIGQTHIIPQSALQFAQ